MSQHREGTSLNITLLAVAAVAAAAVGVVVPLIMNGWYPWVIFPVLGIAAALGIILKKRFLVYTAGGLTLIGMFAVLLQDGVGLSPQQEKKFAAMGNFIAAEIYYQRGQYDSALTRYSQAEWDWFDPQKTWLQFQRGRCYMFLGRDHVALQIFEDLRKNPEKFPLDMSHVYYSLGALKSGNFAQGVKGFNQAIQAHFQTASAYYQLGIHYRRTGKQDEAQKMLSNAYRLGYDRSQVSSLLGSIAEERGDYRRAEELYRRAIRENQENLTAYTKLGSLLFRHNPRRELRVRIYRLGEKRELETRLGGVSVGMLSSSEARGTDRPAGLVVADVMYPANTRLSRGDVILNIEGERMRDLADFKKFANPAKTVLIRGAKIADWAKRPNRVEYAMLYNNLGFVYEEEGQTDKAVLAFKEAIRRAPDYMESFINLAYVYIRHGMLGNAQNVLRSALRMNPGYTPARRMLQELYEPRPDTASNP